MTSLEKVAQAYAEKWAQTSTAETHMRIAHEAGARWALEQMTSEAAVEVGSKVGRYFPGMVRNVLHAVRKEIEG